MTNQASLPYVQTVATGIVGFLTLWQRWFMNLHHCGKAIACLQQILTARIESVSLSEIPCQSWSTLALLALIYDHVIMSDSCSEKRHRSVAGSALLLTMTPQQTAAHVAVYPRFARFVSQAVCVNPNTSALQRMRSAAHGKLRRWGWPKDLGGRLEREGFRDGGFGIRWF